MSMGPVIRPLILPVLLVCVAGCGEQAETPPEQRVSALEPVVVYASHADADYLPDLFNGFTEETGVRVTVRNRDQATNIGDVINDHGSPPADLLLVTDVHGLWRAADEGALRPLRSEKIGGLVPARLRDPDAQWVATSFRTAVIVHNPSAVGLAADADYESLADPRFDDKLCLSSSQLSLNRSLIAMMIDEKGVRPAELIVRGWASNLALPPFDSEPGLLDAVDAGTCAVAIVSSSAAFSHYADQPDATARIHTPAPAYANIEGIALVRHASQPEIALQLIEWLLAENQQQKHSQASFSLPANFAAVSDALQESQIERLSDRNVSVAGWHDEEAVKLAQRARYR